MPGGGDDMLGKKYLMKFSAQNLAKEKIFLKLVFMLKTAISFVIAGWGLIKISVSLIGMG